MAGNLCRCGTYPKIEEAISHVARLIRTEKEVEGRFEEVWLVVEEDALEQWPAGPREIVGRPAQRVTGPMRARGEARYTADLRLPGMLHAAVLRSPARARAREGGSTLERGAGRSGRATRRRSGRRGRPHRRARPRRPGGRGRCSGHDRAGTGGGRADRRRVGRSEAAARPRRGREQGAARRRREPVRARRRRARARPGGRRRRGRVPHADRPPQLVRDASVGVRVARRLGRRLHLDAVHLRRPRRGRGQARPPAGQGARRLRVHGRRLRLEERRGRLHVHRDRAREAHRPSSPLRAHAARGEPRRRQPQRHDPAAHGGGQVRRDAARARRRVRERDRLGRLGRADGRPDAAALRLRERAHRPLPGEAQHAADEGVPRAGLRRGDVRARVPARRARGEARPGLARAAAPQLRELVRRQAVLVEEPDGVLQPRRAALAAARPGARAQRGAVEARSRPREPDLVRRRRPALVRVGAARLRRARDGDHGDAGHRHRHRDCDEPDRGRGARASDRQGRCRLSATPPEGRTRRSRPAPRRRRRWARPFAPPPPTRRAR